MKAQRQASRECICDGLHLLEVFAADQNTNRAKGLGPVRTAAQDLGRSHLVKVETGGRRIEFRLGFVLRLQWENLSCIELNPILFRCLSELRGDARIK